MGKYYYHSIDEVVYSETCSNGLQVFIIPKANYNGVTALMATKFGSLQSKTTIDYQGHPLCIERGVAHFLEHRIFDYKKGPVIDLYSAMGSYANAFTSYDKTVFYFYGTKKIQTGIDLLLDFTRELNVSKESVEKEKEIIINELNMYLDQPESVLLHGMLMNLYKNHEIRYDIGGTEQEVRATSLEMLEAAHATFYHPKNVALIIVGNVNVTECFHYIREKVQTFPVVAQNKYQLEQIVEPNEVNCEYSSVELPIACQKVMIGYKHLPYPPTLDPKVRNKNEIIWSMYLELVFGSSSKLNQKLLEKGVIVSPIDASKFCGENYSSTIISADVYNEEEFIKAIAENIGTVNFSSVAFERCKHAEIAAFIRNLEDVQGLAVNFVYNFFDGVIALEDYDVINSITYEDVVKFAELYKIKNRAIFTIKPKEQVK